MYNTSNPAELYPNTTWELLPDNKFLKTGNTPLQQAGSNSIKLSKANLPAEKLQVENFSLTRGTMNITGQFAPSQWSGYSYTSGAFYEISESKYTVNSGFETNGILDGFDASRSWSGNTSSASPYTSAMGSGTAIAINPEHIIIKAWKRLS